MKRNLNIISVGSNDFNSSLNELNNYFDFDIKFSDLSLKNINLSHYDAVLIHEDYLEKINKEKLKEIKTLKFIFLIKNMNITITDCIMIKLPLNIYELNNLIVQNIIKKKYNQNSSINFKDYILNINSRKLKKGKKSIEITEKEVDLIKTLLGNRRPMSKNDILNNVWKYSSDADTHTVETHIYRLRKKIKDKFNDENFIINKKIGYSI